MDRAGGRPAAPVPHHEDRVGERPGALAKPLAGRFMTALDAMLFQPSWCGAPRPPARSLEPRPRVLQRLRSDRGPCDLHKGRRGSRPAQERGRHHEVWRRMASRTLMKRDARRFMSSRAVEYLQSPRQDASTACLEPRLAVMQSSGRDDRSLRASWSAAAHGRRAVRAGRRWSVRAAGWSIRRTR